MSLAIWGMCYRMNRLRSNLLIVILFILASSASSCPTSPVSSGSTSVATLPADWPIPQLRFTGNVVLSRACPKHIIIRSDGARIEAWDTRVHCEKHMAGVAVQVEKRIAPLGYLAQVSNPRSPKTELWMREYISRDGFTSIMIIRDPSRNGQASFSEITSTNPADDYTCTDYSIIIFKSDTIDPIMEDKQNGEDSSMWQLIPLR
jgi:hypothetical protein